MSGAVDYSLAVKALAYQALMRDSEPSCAHLDTNVSLAEFEADHQSVYLNVHTAKPFLTMRSGLTSFYGSQEHVHSLSGLLTTQRHFVNSMVSNSGLIDLITAVEWSDISASPIFERLQNFSNGILQRYTPIDSLIEIFAEKLDKHSAERIEMFLACEQGWDGDDAMPLSKVSLRKCSDFISEYDLKDKGVGVFMDADGNMVLNWPLPKDESKLIEITFGESSYSLYISGWDDRIEREELDATLKGYLRQVI